MKKTTSVMMCVLVASMCMMIFAAVAAEPEIRLVAKGFGWPEGPFIDDDGNIILANLTNNYLNKVTPDGDVSVLRDIGAVNNGVIPDKHGDLYLASTMLGIIQKLNMTTGEMTLAAATSEGDSLNGSNDFAWHPNGRLYFTDPWTSKPDNLVGGVHFFERDGTVKRFTGGLAYPNGLAFTRDFKYLYVGETPFFRIWKYEIGPDGRAGEQILFAELGEKVLPDGMKVDQDGNLWVAVHTERALWCLNPAGEKIHVIDLPNDCRPTNLIFGGPDMKTAYVTGHEANDDTIALNGQGGALYEIKNMPVAGLPLIP
jgi:gluconolactonase